MGTKFNSVVKQVGKKLALSEEFLPLVHDYVHVDYHPHNWSKQFQETHTITTAKFECKTLVCVKPSMHAVSSITKVQFSLNFLMCVTKDVFFSPHLSSCFQPQNKSCPQLLSPKRNGTRPFFSSVTDSRFLDRSDSCSQQSDQDFYNIPISKGCQSRLHIARCLTGVL